MLVLNFVELLQNRELALVCSLRLQKASLAIPIVWLLQKFDLAIQKTNVTQVTQYYVHVMFALTS